MTTAMNRIDTRTRLPARLSADVRVTLLGDRGDSSRSMDQDRPVRGVGVVLVGEVEDPAAGLAEAEVVGR